MKKDIQIRTLRSDISLQENEEKRTITGFIPYNSRSEYMGFFEYITPTAFNKTLADRADVKALVNHDTSKVLGRVKNGSLRLSSNMDGLHIECDLPDTTYARDVYELIKNDYCTTMSFGFRIIQEDYGIEEGREVHYLREVALDEVSFGVAFPAYTGTDSAARNIRGIDLNKLEATLSKDELKDEDVANLSSIIDQLRSLIPSEQKPVEQTESTEAVEDTSAADARQQFLDELYRELKAFSTKE